jgi:hypothetical protein
LLDPDHAKLLNSFLTLSKTRDRPDSFSGQQARLSLTDIRTGWETSKWQSFGMPFDEFLSWMLALDAEFLDYCAVAVEQSAEIGRRKT